MINRREMLIGTLMSAFGGLIGSIVTRIRSEKTKPIVVFGFDFAGVFIGDKVVPSGWEFSDEIKFDESMGFFEPGFPRCPLIYTKYMFNPKKYFKIYVATDDSIVDEYIDFSYYFARNDEPYMLPGSNRFIPLASPIRLSPIEQRYYDLLKNMKKRDFPYSSRMLDFTRMCGNNLRVRKEDLSSYPKEQA